MSNSLLLSVCIITYNQELYIKETIESILRQKTNFKFEILIADDCSTDATRKICIEYSRKFPEKIKVVEAVKNVGLTANFFNSLKSCSGKYIAICEGDDYWTDDYKLQKQVDVLETNNQYIGCFHNTEERYQEGVKASFLYCSFSEATSISYKQLCFSNIIPTCSIVFRNLYIKDIPDWVLKLKMADWVLHLINAEHGDFFYIPQVMGVHRLSTKSAWSLQSKRKNIEFVLEAYDELIIRFTNNAEFLNQLKKGRRKLFLLNKYPLLNYVDIVTNKVLKIWKLLK